MRHLCSCIRNLFFIRFIDISAVDIVVIRVVWVFFYDLMVVIKALFQLKALSVVYYFIRYA